MPHGDDALDDRLAEAGVTWIVDHDYWTAWLKGFGSPTECEHVYSDTGQRCGEQPERHKAPKHRSPLDPDSGLTSDKMAIEVNGRHKDVLGRHKEVSAQ